jgi:organic hydroperoxide reductase OsmC/OhrA
MAEKRHEYQVKVTWQGNAGTGTSGYRDYGRDHVISVEGKPDILASADPAFRGDPARWNPEDLFLASLSACHKLWYLHFCAVSGVIVVAYEDHAEGVMEMDADGTGRFTDVLLKPRVTIKRGTFPELALELHRQLCEFSGAVPGGDCRGLAGGWIYPDQCVAEGGRITRSAEIVGYAHLT